MRYYTTVSSASKSRRTSKSDAEDYGSSVCREESPFVGEIAGANLRSKPGGSEFNGYESRFIELRTAAEGSKVTETNSGLRHL